VYRTASAAELAEEDQGAKGKDVEALAPVNHFNIKYIDFNKDFYVPHSSVASKSVREVMIMQGQLDLETEGGNIPAPVTDFAKMGLGPELQKRLQKAGFTEATPIQAQAIPLALQGRDLIGIARTGSGKTVAFLLPMIIHIMDQPYLRKGEGPIAVVVTPTRELADQIYTQAKKFSKSHKLRIVPAFGGMSKHDQFKMMKGGAEVAVCTPGRLIDLISKKACTMKRCTYVILDEADRMFAMGFEMQVRTIVNQIRPDRQTLLFSATFQKRVEKLARDILKDPAKVVVGTAGGAAKSVRQVVDVLNKPEEKFPWLLKHLPAFANTGSVIVFVGQKQATAALAKALCQSSFKAKALHGDMTQHDRMLVIQAFKRKEFDVLVSTDVAARGLDIKV